MKKFNFAILLICIFSMIFTNISWASSMRGTLDVYDVDDCMVFYLNGEEFYGSHFVKKGTTYMQLKDLGDVLGIDLNWNQSDKRVSFFVGDKKVELWIGKTTANIGGNKVKLSSPPCIVNGRTYLPLRFVSELLGLKVNYIDVRNEVKFCKELIFKHHPDWRHKLAKGKYKTNMGAYAQFFFVVDGYNPEENTLLLHAFDIIEYPEEGHTATYNWYNVDLDTYKITDIITDEVIEKGGSLSSKYLPYLTKEDYVINVNGEKISVDYNSKKLESILGKGKVSIEEDEVYNEGGFYYHYEKDGLYAVFTNGTYIYILSTTNPKHTTPRGLRVGDSYNKMVKLYGKGSIAYVEGNKVVYQFSQGGPGDEIFFDFFVTVDKSTGKVVQYNFGTTL